jgi:glycosyltransferase involved in cell wall biosynthesis
MSTTGVTHTKKTRLLLITKDTDILQAGSPSYRRVADLQEVFREVHVVVLNRKGRNTNKSTQRLSENVWVHTTNSSSWWRLSYDAYTIAETQLIFSGALCADVIVAEDMCEAGLVGLFLSKKHDAPLQIHIYEREMDTTPKQHALLQSFISAYLLSKVTNIRTETESRRDTIISTSQNPALHIEVLPNYYDAQVWQDFISVDSLHNKYPQFKTIILHIATQSLESREVMNGVAEVLREHPSVGLVIVGGGPFRPQLERQAIALGLQTQIEFEPVPNEILSLLKAADILVHVSNNESEDEIVLMSGVIGLPVITYGTPCADNVSAYECTKGDVPCITQGLQAYLSTDAEARIHRIETVYEAVQKYLARYYEMYLKAYAKSIDFL